MTTRSILPLFLATFVLTEAKWHRQQRDVASICNAGYSTEAKIMCYCVKDARDPDIIRSADCYLKDESVKPDDHASWATFETLKNTTKFTLTDNRGIAIKYIPTMAMKHLHGLLELDIKHGNIEKVHKFAFANHTNVKEISLRANQITVLEKYAFAHHKHLTEIKLDKNNIAEINRNVFVDLPSLEKLYLTDNQITTLHDKAFMHLNSLKELEINFNKLFSLNSDTFTGLHKLLKLDLSSNNLEVIGDNTFSPLTSLQSLNLDDNKIQMLDEKAFFGLRQLQQLSLANNKLSDIQEKVFMGLEALKSLSLRANEIKELKPSVMAPILENFYNVEGHLDVEDNLFPCSCKLDWFLQLMNQTQNKNLRISIENLKCQPDSKLREKWTALEEKEKTSPATFDTEAEDAPVAADYEYYDESQLNGKLFYTDVRDLICENALVIPSNSKSTGTITTSTITTTKTTKVPYLITNTNKVSITPHPATTSHNHHSLTSQITSTTTAYVPRETSSGLQKNTHANEPHHFGLLDLSKEDTTDKAKEVHENEILDQNKPDYTKRPDYTTTRLATVSAKPERRNSVYDNMAADEAKPDRLKQQQILHEEVRKYSNRGHKHVGCVVLISITFFRVFN